MSTQRSTNTSQMSCNCVSITIVIDKNLPSEIASWFWMVFGGMFVETFDAVSLVWTTAILPYMKRTFKYENIIQNVKSFVAYFREMNLQLPFQLPIRLPFQLPQLPEVDPRIVLIGFGWFVLASFVFFILVLARRFWVWRLRIQSLQRLQDHLDGVRTILSEENNEIVNWVVKECECTCAEFESEPEPESEPEDDDEDDDDPTYVPDSEDSEDEQEKAEGVKIKSLLKFGGGKMNMKRKRMLSV